MIVKLKIYEDNTHSVFVYADIDSNNLSPNNGSDWNLGEVSYITRDNILSPNYLYIYRVGYHYEIKIKKGKYVLHHDTLPSRWMIDKQSKDIIWINYFEKGFLHSEEEPAVTPLCGFEQHGGPMWYLNGKEYSFNEWCKTTDKSNEEITYLKLKYNQK